MRSPNLNGGKHPCGSTSLLYMSNYKGGRGMRSIETEYKETKMKVAVNLYQNRDPAMKMVCVTEGGEVIPGQKKR